MENFSVHTYVSIIIFIAIIVSNLLNWLWRIAVNSKDSAANCFLMVILSIVGLFGVGYLISII